MSAQDHNRMVFCQGHRDVVPRGKADFVIWGGAYCYFCKRCIRIIQRAWLEGREATPEELQKRRNG